MRTKAIPLAPSFSLLRLLRITRKELRETLRDRRTIFTLVLMPILVYSLLSMAFRQFLLSSVVTESKIDWHVAADSKETMSAFLRQISLGEAVLLREQDAPRPREKSSNPTQPPSTPAADSVVPMEMSDIKPFVEENLEQLVQAGKVDLGVRMRLNTIPSLGGKDAIQHDFELIYRKDSPVSRNIAQFCERRLWAVNQHWMREQLKMVGHSGIVANLWTLRSLDEGDGQLVSMATLIPLILILMTITGAVYPAIDLTAGERERGTLESLMAAPLPRLSLLIAKYIAVLTVAILTATANLLGMSITVYSTGLGSQLFGERGLSPSAIAIVFLLLVLFAAFFSALLLAVTSFARSFKEAQAYLIPFMLLAISPGFLSVMPGIELNALLAVTPLVNIVLLARDVLQGEVHSLLAGVAVISTMLYGVAALALAARIFGSDAILYGSQGSWSDLIRRPDQPHPAASLTGAALCTALVFALQSVLSGFLGQNKDVSLASRLIASAIVTALLYGLFPLVLSRIQFVAFRSGFQLQPPPVAGVAGAILLGLSLWPLAHEMVVLAGNFFPWLTIEGKQLAGVAKLAQEIAKQSPLLLVTTIALAPAVCEEWFFRGYLLSSLRQRWSAWPTILTTALVFGLFHVFVGGMVSPIRFLPSTCLGIVLGWVCWRTRSVLPGMLLHALHNGLLILIGRYREDLQRVGIGIAEQQHLPIPWLAASLVGVLLGLALVWLSRLSLGKQSLAD